MRKILLLLFIQVCIGSAFAQAQTTTTPAKPRGALPVIRIGDFTFYPEVMERIITKKIGYFNKYTQILCDKKPDYKNAIPMAMRLFNDDTSKKVDITDRNGKHTIKKIKKYLVALSQLPYDKVEINDYGVVFVSKLEKQPDGTYVGTAKMMQSFTAVKEGRVVYHDEIERTFQIILKVWEEVNEGKTTQRADVFLGDMYVTDILKS